MSDVGARTTPTHAVPGDPRSKKVATGEDGGQTHFPATAQRPCPQLGTAGWGRSQRVTPCRELKVNLSSLPGFPVSGVSLADPGHGLEQYTSNGGPEGAMAGQRGVDLQPGMLPLPKGPLAMQHLPPTLPLPSPLGLSVPI